MVEHYAGSVRVRSSSLLASTISKTVRQSPGRFFFCRAAEQTQRVTGAERGDQHRMHSLFRARTIAPALTGLAALALTACSGGGGGVLGPISNFGPGGNSAQVRFVNGSPDAGPVQIFIDNQQQFCTNGNTGSACSVSYGHATTYAVNLNAGNHAIVLRDANGNQITLPAASIAVNGGFKYSLELAGEVHPSYSSTPTLQLLTTTEQPFNTPGGGAALNFHYAAPYVQSTNPGAVQFGYFNNNVPAANAVGSPVNLGAETTPQGITSGLNTPFTFYAISPTSGITATPNQFSSQCSSNALPCDTGNLSLYLVDGPAASTQPTATTLPNGVNASTKAFFVGVFDQNG